MKIKVNFILQRIEDLEFEAGVTILGLLGDDADDTSNATKDSEPESNHGEEEDVDVMIKNHLLAKSPRKNTKVKRGRTCVKKYVKLLIFFSRTVPVFPSLFLVFFILF